MKKRESRAPRLVLKLGGELLEQPQDLERVARAIARLVQRASLVVVHGGGKEIDAALATAGIPKQQVDGLRVTDARTLDVVVAVLAGAINTRLVAAVRRAGAKAGRLDGRRRDRRDGEARGADCQRGWGIGRSGPGRRAGPQRRAAAADRSAARGYVPIVACIGATREAVSCST